MFVDGLDEIDGPYDSILRMIKDLANQKNVKICLSSRPLPVFEEAFNEAPGLRLQDLTYDSIKAYAHVQLSGLVEKQLCHKKHDKYQARELVDKIMWRAEGVFLWAVIAIREIRDGLQDLVNLDELERAIDSLPSELEGLFMLMLDRIKPAYQRDAARFLQIALQKPQKHHEHWDSDKLNLCRFHFIHSQRELNDTPFSHEKVPSSDVVLACKTLRVQLLSHTAGLLELTPKRGDPDINLLANEDEVLQTEVNFLHRTARDFLTQNDKARSFLARKGYSKAQLHLAIARGTLAQLAQFTGWYKPPPAYPLFTAALQHITLTERHVGAAQSNLMRSLVDESYVQRYSYDYEEYECDRPVPALMVDENGLLIDVVAVAAATGMTLYVCEQPNISSVSRNYDPDLPGLLDYPTNRAIPVTMRVTLRGHSEGSGWMPAVRPGLPIYRQTLEKYVRGNLDNEYPASRGILALGTENEYPAQDGYLQTPQEWVQVAFAETYLLWHCKPDCTELVRILLHTGANPMVKFRVKGPGRDRLQFKNRMLLG